MATSASHEASEIRRRGRQRLIGAVAIVLLLVVFVPMMLDSEPRPARNEPVLAIPAKENPPPLPPPAAAAKAEPPRAEPPRAEPPRAEPPKPASVTPEAPVKAGPKLEGFAVQVGAFRDDEKLRQARDKLGSAGIAHYTERLDNSAGALTRLRAGPFATRDAAEAAATKLRGIALQGQVVALP